MRPVANAGSIGGAVYFAIVFAIAFVFGAIRVLFVAGLFGDFLAVAIEAPFTLATSWFVCRHIVRRFHVAPDWATRAGMGATAFALLAVAEISLGLFGFGRSLAQQWAALSTPAGALGLAGQIGFAFIPILQARISGPKPLVPG